MNRSILTKGAMTLLILLGGWASPSILVSSQETETPEEVLPTVTTVTDFAKLEVTNREIVVEYGDELDAQELVVAGFYDSLSLPATTTQELGEQTLIFKAVKGDSQVTVQKEITVVDSQGPEFLETVDNIKVDYNEVITVDDIRKNFAASDNVDGDLHVLISGSYDEKTSGKHNFVAFAEDSSGNRAEHSFTITVGAKPVTKTYTTYSTGNYGTRNTYGAGWCTWWAASRRIDIGKPLPNTLGHAKTWLERAPRYGQTVVWGVPKVGAVVSPSYNHVAFVERVNADGSIYISEMGWGYRAWGYNERTISASAASRMGYIY